MSKHRLTAGVFCLSLLAGSLSAQKVVSTPVMENRARLPLAFEKHTGGSGERFVARGQGYLIGLDAGKAAIRITSGENTSQTVSLAFAGASPGKAVVGPELPGKVNYIRGNDPHKWEIGLPTYARVTYPDTYPGIDVVYYGNQQQLEFDLLVKPGADPEAIRLKLEGADKLSIDASGALSLGEAAGGLRVALPRIYQEVNGAKKNIPGHYAIVGRDDVAFRVDPWDRTRTLVIDPAIVYSTLFGGGLSSSNGNLNSGQGIALDPSGNIIIAGGTFAADFPTVNAVQKNFEGTGDVFVTKINPAGTAFLYSTYLGGATFNSYPAIHVAVDSTGAAWVAGYTLSGNFPVLNAAQTTYGAGGEDAFVARFNSAGLLQFSTFLGGTNADIALGIAVDSANNGYVTGYTNSTDFPTTAGVIGQTLSTGNDAFVTKYSPSGAVLYSTLLGGGSSYGSAIAVDSLGNAYITGPSSDTTFPGAPPGGAQTTNNGNGDAFVAKLNPTATALLYFTFLGGTGSDAGTAIAVDGSFNAYIAGTTSSTGLATAGAAQTALAGATNAFAAKLNVAGSAFTWVTYLGGGRVESLNGLALDGSGNVYLTGNTDSNNFPTVSAIQPAYPGNGISLFNSTNSAGSFSAADSNIPGVVSDASINPAGTSAVVLTNSGIYRTVNGGSSWTQQSQFTGSHLARSPVAPATLYATGISGFQYVVYQSTDDGVTWNDMGTAPGLAFGLLADPLTAGTVYFFGFTSPYVFKSTNGGATFNPAATGLPGVYVPTMAATSDGSLYAGTLNLSFAGGFGVYKSTNQGGSWTAVNTGLPANAGSTINSLGASGTTVYFANGFIFETTNGGASWAATSSGYVGAGSLAVSPQNASVLFALTYSGGTVLGSTNGGATFSSPGTGLPANAYFYNSEVVVDSSNTAHVLFVAPVNQAGYVAKLDSTGSALTWSTYLGGTGQTNAYAVATDGVGDAFVTGNTPGASGFPVTASPFPAGASNAFLVEISDATPACSNPTVTPGSALASQNGGLLYFSVVAPSGCAWTAMTDQPWAVITSGASGNGSGVITIQIAANSGNATQSAVLTVGSQRVTITQPGNSCSYSLDKGSYLVPAAGGRVSANLTATAGCPWAVTNNYASAISFTTGSSGSGNATIGLTVAANLTASAQNFSLAIGTTQINVAQAALTSQTITFDKIPTQIYGVSPFVIAAQSSALLPVTFVSDTPSVCKTADDLVMLLNIGTCAITASQPGNGSYAAATSVTNLFDSLPALTSGTLTQATHSPIGVGSQPQSVAVGDFNGDGIPDLATAGQGGVTVLLGSVSGAFTPPLGSPFATGPGPISVAVGDFNGDGIQDLVTANNNGNNVTVLLGNGSGGFTAASGSPFTVGSAPYSVTVGDFNGDGILDLVTGNSGDNTVTVLLGNGSAGFTAASGSPFAAGTFPYFVAVGDFDGNGVEDLAIANFVGAQLTVLLGNGSGGFTAASGSPFAVGTNPESVAVGDFDGDGNQDLAVANSGSHNVTVLLGNGSGGFTASTVSPFGAGTEPSSLAVGDFDGDGVPDLVVATNSSNVAVLLGDSSGGFVAASGSPFPVGAQPISSVMVADFNGDGFEDLVTANTGSSNVTVLLGGLTPTSSVLSTTSPLTIPFGQSVPLSLAVSDTGTAFNGLIGTATFMDGANTLGTTSLSTSPYTFNASSLAVGSHTLTAVYSGGYGSAGSTSNTITIQVLPSQTITFGNLSNVTIGVAPFTISATASSGLTVSFASNTLSVCTVNIATVTILTAGTCSITASQAGDGTYAAATPVTQTFTVLQAQAIAFDAIPRQILGVSPFVIAAQSSALLPVTFVSDTTSVCKNADDVVMLLSAGTCSITASQPGNATYGAATSLTQSFTVSQANPAGTLTPAAGSPFLVGATAAPIAAATGDFNGDGIPDLAVNDYVNDVVDVFLGNGSGGFTAAPNSPFATGVRPSSVATGDFNGDGHQDLAVTNNLAGTVTVLLGDGMGNFTPAANSPFPAATGPESVVVGDFNQDGIQDLAIANSGSDNVTLLLGNGSGGFTAAMGSPFLVGFGPESIAVGDFDGDGFPDLAIANGSPSGNNVTVLLGNGTGGFTQPVGSPFAAGSAPYAVVVGDFNGDGIPDLATANMTSNNVTVLLGNGMGGFAPAPGSPFPVGVEPISLVVGDFNGDGIPDLATQSYVNNNVTVLLGSGSGAFITGSGSPFPVGVAPHALVVADFNRDGMPDIAAANYNAGNVTVLLAALTPTSSVLSTTSALTIPFGQSVPLSLAVSDTGTAFNTLTGTATFVDGANTLGTASQAGSPYTFSASSLALGNHTLTAVYSGGSGSAGSTSNALTVQVLQSQTITFGNLSNVPLGVAPFTVSATASSNLTVSFASNTLSVCTVNIATVTILTTGTCSINASQAGNGTYAAATPVTQIFTVLQTQTITFDAIPNQIFGISPFPIAAQSSALLPVTFVSNTPSVCKNSDDLVMLLNAGTCAITASQPGNAAYSTATPVTKSFTVSQALPTGALKPAAGSPFTVGTNPISAAVGDFNGDGIPDLATANSGNNTVTVLLGNGSGGFTAATGSPFTVGTTPYSVAVGDFNGDGTPDLAVANINSNNVTVLLGNGSGGFTQASGSPFAVGTNPFSVAVGDFNGDGIQDLAVANHGDNTVTLLLGNGAGGFTAATGSPFTVGTRPYSMAVGDFNGDGKPDLAVANTNSNNVTLLLGNGSGGFVAASGSPFPVGTNPISAAVGDFNGDGIQDLAVANSGDNTVTLLLGNGSGGFTAATGSPFAVGSGPYSVAVGDFNGDGIQDLATANANTSNVTVLLGNGAGGFTAAAGSPFTVGATPESVVVADFNGDGMEDIATANTDATNVTVLLGTPGQIITFGALNNVALGVAPFTISATASSGLPVSFASTTTGVCTVSGSIVTVAATGTCSITASQAGNASYPAAANVMQSFTVGGPSTPSVTVISLSPNSAPVGTPALSLTITGTGFTASSVVLFNGSALPTTFLNAGKVTATVSAALLNAAGQATVSVGESNALLFYVVAPTITSLSPSNTPGGNPQFTLTVNGSGFVNGVSTVDFNGTALATTFVNSGQLTAIVPANQSGFNVPVTVVNLTTSSNPLIFTLGPAQYSCAVNGGTPPLLRVGGEAELLGDFVLSCTPGASSNGVMNQDITVQPSNFNFTSRILNAATGATEALLLVGDPAPAAQVLGTNVFQGVQSGSNILFPGVALDTTAATTLRIVNLRANTLPLQLGTAAQTASVGVNMGPIAVTNAFQTLGFALPISFQEANLSSAGNQTSVQLNFTENFANTFRIQVAPGGVQNIPGTPYNTESGFVNPSLVPGAGLADSGTRLLLQVNGVPAGVNVYAAVSSDDGISASLVATDSNGVAVGENLISGSSMFGGTYAPVSVSNGTGVAVWEVVSASAPTTLSFHIVATGMTQAGLGPITLEGSIAPLSPVTTASATDPLPRFSINSLTSFIDLNLISTSSTATRSTGAQALAALAANPLTVAYRGRPVAAPTADGLPVSGPSPIQAGSSVTFGFSAVNQSAGAVTQVTIQSNVPSLLTVGSCSAPGGSCSNSANPDGGTSVTAVYPGPVQPGDSTSLSYVATACTSCTENSTATVSTTVNGLNANQQFVSDADPDDNTSNSSVTVVGTAPQVTVQFATNPPGLTLQIPQGISPVSQSGNLSFSAVTPQPGPDGSQYVFSSWSDGSTSAVRTAVPVPVGGGTFTAGFIAQYPLNVTASAGGAVALTPASTGNFYSAGATVQISATPAPGYVFSGFTGDVSSIITPLQVVMPATTLNITANFAVALQTISFGSVPTQIMGNAPFTLNASASSGLAVKFASNSTGVCTVSGTTVTLISAGTCSITATQPGNSFYPAAAPVTVTFTVDPVFADLGDQTPNEQAATDLLASYGITSGCSSAPFEYCPDTQIPRNQMAVFIIRSIFGSNNFTYTQTPYFTDVPANALFFKYIQKMRDLGITTGETATTYGPNDTVTRGEMAVFIIRARYGTGVAFNFTPTPYFTDVPAGAQFFQYIQKMRDVGITSGETATTYGPNDPVTRGQMALFLMRGGYNLLLSGTAPMLSTVSPITGTAGNTVNVTLTGLNTNFAQGTTVVTAGAGITVQNVTVNSATSLTAQLVIAANATLGPQSIVATTGTEEAVAPNGFTITSDPAAGVVAYFTGNNTTVNAVSGLSGTLVNGATYASATSRTQGLPDAEAFSLNGTNSYMQAAAGETATLSGARTLVAWVYPNAGTGLGMPIMTGGPTSAAGDIFGITGTTGTCSSGGQYQLYVDHGGTCYVSDISLTPNTWSLVAVTFDGTNAVFYINGVASVPAPAQMFGYGLSTYEIGGNTLGGTSSGASFNGLLSEVQVYGRALTPAEIQGIYAP